MPRPPEFDRDKVLNSALQVFWSNGYEASSINMLLDAMEINRGSLYAAFGDKKGLFREVMATYVATLSGLISVLAETPDPVEAIRGFFKTAFLDEKELADLPKGCLLFNTVTELSERCSDLATEAGNYLRNVRGLFEQRLTEARTQGLIADRVDPIEGADSLLALLAGTRSLCKMGFDQEQLASVLDMMLANVLEN